MAFDAHAILAMIHLKTESTSEESMKSGKCPKCGSTSIYTQQNELQETRVSGRLQVVDDYVCATCGYFETYLTDKDTLRKITERWKKVGG